MAVAFDASSESHTGTAGSTSEASFAWTHTPSGTPKGVLVYTFSNANASTADVAQAVAYGGYLMTPVPSGRAVDTAGEPGDCKAWLLSTQGHGLPPAHVKVDTGSAETLKAAAYGDDGYWVAVGTNGTILYATDPMGTWTAASSPGFSTTQINSVAYGNGYWVAVGNSGTVRYATDPTGTWSAASSPGFSTSNVGHVLYANGYWVAGCSNATDPVRYATDPTGTWSAPSSYGTTGSVSVLDLTYGNGYWVTAGGTQGIRYASDPTGTWTTATMTGGAAAPSSTNFVAYGNGYWVATGSSVVRYTSNAAPSANWTAPTSSAAATKAAYDNGYWIMVGTPNRHIASTPTGTWGITYGTGYTTATDVFWGGGSWVLTTSTAGLLLVGTTTPVAVPTGAQTVTVYRANTADEMYAVAITVTADYGVEAAGVTAVSADASGGTASLAGTSVDDGSPGTNSLRFAGVNSGLSDVPTANSGTTNTQSIDFGTRVIAVARESSASQGSTSIGWTATADDVAAVYLAIREAIVPWTVGVPIR